MNKSRRYSATQISTAEVCLRKWAWGRIDGIYGPPNKWAALGIETHKQMYEWGRDRRAPRFGAPGVVGKAAELAAALITVAPPPQTKGLEHENKNLLLMDQHEVVLIIDVWNPIGSDVPEVIDYKTTTELFWAKTKEELIDDCQFATYTGWALTTTQSEVVRGKWLYVNTVGKPTPFPVVREVTFNDIQARLEQNLETIKELEAIHQSGIPAIEVPYDASGCDKFGGCPYKELCNLNKFERFSSIMSQAATKAGFLARLQARKGSTPEPSAGQPAQQPLPHPQAVNPAPSALAPQPTPKATVPAKKTAPAAKAPALPPGVKQVFMGVDGNIYPTAEEAAAAGTHPRIAALMELGCSDVAASCIHENWEELSNL